jgi:hypothetical protein
MKEPYTCPECETEHDHAECDDAACGCCGRCPDCAPSEDIGNHEHCDECRGLRASEPDFSCLTQDEMADIQDAVMSGDVFEYQKLTGCLWSCRPEEWKKRD